jgi:hypothetical protein
VIITLLIQARNEVKTGHLQRFLDYNLEIADHSIALDDCSDDGTSELLNLHFDYVIENSVSLFGSETLNKQKLLVTARNKFPDTDWFLWLDADELLLCSRKEIERLINDAESIGGDSIELGLVNLWRSKQYYRLDSGFNNVRNVRLWKNLEHLDYKLTPGLHQPSHPDGLKSTFKVNNLKILHFGFSNMNMICNKYENYRRAGQRGESLWRLIDESHLVLQAVSSEIANLGSRYSAYLKSNVPRDDDVTLESLSVWDYFWQTRLTDNTVKEVNPKITLICLIYAGVDWLEFQYGELLALAKEFSPGQVEILFVTNDATEQVIRFLDENFIPYVNAPGRSSVDEWYINSVYRAYNFGVICAKGDYVFLTNSDMSYTRGFLMNLFKHAEPDKYVVGKLVESGRLASAPGAIEKNFGKKLRRFRRNKFNRFAHKVSREGEVSGGLYMPSIVRRERFLSLGGFPEGNLVPSSLDRYLDEKESEYAIKGQDCLPGDFVFMQKAKLAGIAHVTAQDAIAYHFQEGEKSDHSHGRNLEISSGVGIANDVLLGINGEKVLWNYIIEDLESSKIRVEKFALGFKPSYYRIRNINLWKRPRVRLMFRNATFLGNFKGSWRSISLTQDRVNDKKLLKRQTKARMKSEAMITNSDYFITSDDYSIDSHKYLLPLPVNPIWEKTELQMKDKNDVHNLIAIFVGAFNETKGWQEVKKIIENSLGTEFILVSKYSDDAHGLNSETLKRCRIYRNLKVSELIKLVDESDYMLIGSPFETQCLAAMEAAVRNKPVCMRKTGVLATLPEADRQKVGVFNDDLVEANRVITYRLKNEFESFQPKLVVSKYKLHSEYLRSEWTSVILEELKESFLNKTAPPFREKVRKKLPNPILDFLRRLKRLI